MIPLIYLGDGKFEATTPYHRGRAEKLYGQGQMLLMDEVGEARSQQSHNHYFARLHDLWLTLPEWLNDQYPSETHLRKRALCKTGHCSTRDIVLQNHAEAIMAAAYLYELDPYVYCEVRDRTLTVKRALSQSMQAMGNAKFQRSKTEVLEWIERLIAKPEEAA